MNTLIHEVLRKASLEQARLAVQELHGEIITRSIPILWFGKRTKGNWVTIGTNPSALEFLKEGREELLEGKDARFYHLKDRENLNNFVGSSDAIEQAIQSFDDYFEGNPYRQWFGRKVSKRAGGRLEALLFGLGGSLYGNKDGKQQVVHTDILPFATLNQFSKIAQQTDIEGYIATSVTVKDILTETLNILEPSLIIILGKDNTERYLQMEEGVILNDAQEIPQFPRSRYQIGWNGRRGIPIIGLHFKPSEQLLGLGKSAGQYQKRDALIQMGSSISVELKKEFLQHRTR